MNRPYVDIILVSKFNWGIYMDTCVGINTGPIMQIYTGCLTENVKNLFYKIENFSELITNKVNNYFNSLLKKNIIID